MKQLLTVVVAMGCVLPSWANVASSATIHNISYTLIDLDPTDGIAPDITFRESGLNSFAGTSVVGQPVTGGSRIRLLERYEEGAGPLGPVVISEATDEWLIDASVTSNGSLESIVLRAMLDAQAPTGLRTNTDTQVTAMPLNGLASDWNFALTQRTGVVFYADYEIGAKLYYGDRQPAGPLEYAQAKATMILYESVDGLDAAQSQQYDIEVFDRLDDWSQGVGRTKEGVLSGRIDNLTDQSVNGGLWLSASLHGLAVSAIPEPSTAAYGLLGLLLLGAHVAMRKRHH